MGGGGMAGGRRTADCGRGMGVWEKTVCILAPEEQSKKKIAVEQDHVH